MAYPDKPASLKGLNLLILNPFRVLTYFFLSTIGVAYGYSDLSLSGLLSIIS